jgi:hydrogenase maturation protein HypF
VVIRGAVQGVGFRPFVFRMATEEKLCGWISNSAQGVFIEAEGAPASLRRFLARLEKEKPPRAIIQSLEPSFLDCVGYTDFRIRESEDRGERTALILPDIATCADCRREIFDPRDRRFRYPFTNCTNCGPRFSIIEALPYDRANTSMKKFVMCAECDREYHDPRNRRFHAQPNACPICGPQLQLWDENGAVLAKCDEALREAAQVVRDGRILALKGLGGFQLIVDARKVGAVNRLRERKHREEKPFAVMFPSLEEVRKTCTVSELEERLLLSPESPIVLLAKLEGGAPATPGARELAPPIDDSVAPGNPNLGVMLPYTPLHYLFTRELDFPVVATSGNLSDEPICIDEDEALERLRGIADSLLIHDRPIVRHVDDSIVRVMCGRGMVMRRARGYAPLPISHRSSITDHRSPNILALGAHLKNTVALKMADNVFVSQHIGDLATKQAHHAFTRAVADLPRLYDAKIDVIAHDLHPDYLSTKHAHERAQNQSHLTTLPIQHHWAHVAACMAENEITAPALGVSWDGTGYGLDGTIWGGEFLRAKEDGHFERVAHLRTFRLPGGDAAMREPCRTALGLLHEIFGDAVWSFPKTAEMFSEKERTLLRQMLEKKINAPSTSSAGRLFDAVASLIGLRQRVSFEGQAAMELEFARRDGIRDSYPFEMSEAAPLMIDWEPAIRALLDDVARPEDGGVMAAKFHNGLIEMVVAAAKKIREEKVILTGGCFQNRYLTERTVERLREENFRPYWHQRIPPNDGGISFGQAVVAGWQRR